MSAPLPALSAVAPLLDRLPVAVWAVDRDLRFVFRAGGAFRHLSIRGRENAGTLWEFFDTKDPEHPAIRAYRKIMEEGPTCLRLGRAGEVISHGAPWHAEDGSVAGVVGAALDASDQMQAEQRFATFMRFLPAMAYALDEDLRLTWVNPALAQRLGRTGEQVVGRRAAELEGWPDSASHDAENLEVLRTGRPMVVRAGAVDDSGVAHHTYGYRFPLPAPGNEGVGGLLLDVTEQVIARRQGRAAEARLRAIVDHAGVAIAVCSLDGVLTEGNMALGALVGTTPSRLRGQHVDKLLRPEVQGQPSLLGELLRGGSARRVRRALLRQKDGGSLPVTVVGLQVRDGGREPLEAVLLVQPAPCAPVQPDASAPRDREDRRLLGMVAEGASDAAIAKAFGMAESTVRARLLSLKRRYGATNRASLVARAYQRGLLVP